MHKNFSHFIFTTSIATNLLWSTLQAEDNPVANPTFKATGKELNVVIEEQELKDFFSEIITGILTVKFDQNITNHETARDVSEGIAVIIYSLFNGKDINDQMDVQESFYNYINTFLELTREVNNKNKPAKHNLRKELIKRERSVVSSILRLGNLNQEAEDNLSRHVRSFTNALRDLALGSIEQIKEFDSETKAKTQALDLVNTILGLRPE